MGKTTIMKKAGEHKHTNTNTNTPTQSNTRAVYNKEHVHVYISPEALQILRMHKALTGEYKSHAIERLILEHLSNK
ncbi:hypothetical protein ES702_05979 [subsurface metagenome]